MFKFPYTNLHELNLDWILEKVKTFAELIPPMQTAVEDVQGLQTDVEQAVEDANQAVQDAQSAIETAEEAKEIAEQAAQGTIADGAVTTAKLADGAVTSAKIADRSISGNDIAPGTIQTGNLSEGCVTTVQILDGTILNGDISDNAINTSKIADASVTGAKLAYEAGTVTETDLDDVVTQVWSFTAYKKGGTATIRLSCNISLTASESYHDIALLSENCRPVSTFETTTVLINNAVPVVIAITPAGLVRLRVSTGGTVSGTLAFSASFPTA